MYTREQQRSAPRDRYTVTPGPCCAPQTLTHTTRSDCVSEPSWPGLPASLRRDSTGAQARRAGHATHRTARADEGCARAARRQREDDVGVVAVAAAGHVLAHAIAVGGLRCPRHPAGGGTAEGAQRTAFESHDRVDAARRTRARRAAARTQRRTLRNSFSSHPPGWLPASQHWARASLLWRAALVARSSACPQPPCCSPMAKWQASAASSATCAPPTGRSWCGGRSSWPAWSPGPASGRWLEARRCLSCRPTRQLCMQLPACWLGSERSWRTAARPATESAGWRAAVCAGAHAALAQRVTLAEERREEGTRAARRAERHTCVVCPELTPAARRAAAS